MSVNEQTSAVFNAFIEADKALKELPAVKAELDTTKHDLASANDALNNANSKANMLQGTIEALQAELHAKEAALAAATFREGQLSKVVDSIRGALPVVATGHSDVSVADKANEGQSEAGPTSHVASTEGSSNTAPTPTAESGMSAGGTGDSASEASSSHSEVHPTLANASHPTEATHNTPINPSPESNQSTESFGGHPPAHADTPNMNSGPLGDNVSQREANPTVGDTHTESQSAFTSNAENKSDASTTAATSNLTYLGHYPHEKPSYLSWSEWDALGGQTPPWYVRKA